MPIIILTPGMKSNPYHSLGVVLSPNNCNDLPRLGKGRYSRHCRDESHVSLVPLKRLVNFCGTLALLCKGRASFSCRTCRSHSCPRRSYNQLPQGVRWGDMPSNQFPRHSNMEMLYRQVLHITECLCIWIAPHRLSARIGHKQTSSTACSPNIPQSLAWIVATTSETWTPSNITLCTHEDFDEDIITIHLRSRALPDMELGIMAIPWRLRCDALAVRHGLDG